jgi:hypothetical protein
MARRFEKGAVTQIFFKLVKRPNSRKYLVSFQYSLDDWSVTSKKQVQKNAESKFHTQFLLQRTIFTYHSESAFSVQDHLF